MNNLPTNQRDVLTPSLQAQEERLSHREWIGGRIVTVLSHYWRDDDDEPLTAAIAADWADVLEGMTKDAIQKACIQYQREEPRRKPTPGAIYALARGFMPRPQVVETPEPPRHDPTPEERARVADYLAKAGFAPKRFGGDQ